MCSASPDKHCSLSGPRRTQQPCCWHLTGPVPVPLGSTSPLPMACTCPTGQDAQEMNCKHHHLFSTRNASLYAETSQMWPMRSLISCFCLITGTLKAPGSCWALFFPPSRRLWKGHHFCGSNWPAGSFPPEQGLCTRLSTWASPQPPPAHSSAWVFITDNSIARCPQAST